MEQGDAIQLEFNQLNDELNQIADTDFNGRPALNGGTMADGSVAGAPAVVAGKPTVNINAIDNPSAAVTYHGGVHGSVDAGGNGTINVDGVSLKVRGGEIVKNDGTGTGEYKIGKDDNSKETTFEATTALEVENGKVNGEITVTTQIKINADTSKVTIYGEEYDVKATYKTDGTLDDFVLIDANGDEVDTTNIAGAEVSYDVKNGEGYIEVKQIYTVEDGVVKNEGGQTVGNVDLKKGVSVSDAFEHGIRNLTYSDSITLQTGSRSKDAVNFTFAYTTSGIGDLTADLDISARGLGTAQLSRNR